MASTPLESWARAQNDHATSNGILPVCQLLLLIFFLFASVQKSHKNTYFINTLKNWFYCEDANKGCSVHDPSLYIYFEKWESPGLRKSGFYLTGAWICQLSSHVMILFSCGILKLNAPRRLELYLTDSWAS